MSAIENPLFMDISLPVKTILVVEDDQSISEFLKIAILQETRYHPLFATGRIPALKAVQDSKPNLFLLDYYLHSTTGIALYDELHAMDGLEDVPAIIFTAGNLEAHRQEIEERHLIWISKPIDLDELLGTINNLLE
jgi:DNA-binding NtrC family response regulator